MNPIVLRNTLWLYGKLTAVCLLTLLCASVILAQDENFDSPTPILVSEPDSTRALAISADDWQGYMPKTVPARSFDPGSDSRVILFVTNLTMLESEGASAFRVYLEDAGGRVYRMKVENIQPLAKDNSLAAVTVVLHDRNAYNGQPLPTGDHLVRLTWRGLSSNRVRLGLGKLGGEIKDDALAAPTGYPLKREAKEKAEDAVMAEYAGLAEYSGGFKYNGDRSRFMEQATFGPNTALNDRLRRVGIRVWIAEQLEKTTPSVAYPPLPQMNFDSNATANSCNAAIIPTPPATCFRDNYQVYPMQKWFYTNAFYGENQLLHRTSWSLSQIWVTAMPTVPLPGHMLQYQKILDRNAFGNYRNLMQEMTLNPAMGDYLDMLGSTRNNPNENYAREILQLFTIGLVMLNQDGTPQLDNNGDPIPSYTQDTVNNFTEVFTGWQLCSQAVATCPNNIGNGVLNYIDPMLLNQNLHNVTTKTLLNYPGAPNVNLPANQNGVTDLNQALDNIFNHPNVGPFVGKLMIQHMVTSDPTPAYVSRVAGVFNNNGQGVRGDMKAVVRAILLDPEARGNIKTDPNYGKLREPVQLMTNVFRNFDVRGAAGPALPSDGIVADQATAMLQNVYGSPSVFNYYPADFVVPGTDVLGPEFGVMHTGTAITRMNFFNTIVFNTITVSNPNRPNGTSIDLTGLQALAAADPTCNQLVDELNKKMMHGTMSPQMRTSILTATTAVSAANTLARARQALYLVATSSQFQVQR